jgi:hypothetical protein
MNATAALALIGMLTLGTPLFARTLHVPREYNTIQSAINDANDGDTVLVAPGTYTGDGNRDIGFKGKAITMRSESGPETCIIDCQGSAQQYHSGFYFHSDETADSVLEGFTITGGYWDEGDAAAIMCLSSSPRIVNCVVMGNAGVAHYTYHRATVIALWDSNAVLSNCLILGNRGDAIHCGGQTKDHPLLSSCTIVANQGRALSSNGGGYGGRAYLKNCIITNNRPPNLSVGTQVCIDGCATVQGCIDVQFTNCCVEDDPNAFFVEAWHNPRQPPTGNVVIRADPLFAAPGHWDANGTPDRLADDFWVNGDYHLKSQAGRWDPNSRNWVVDDVTSPCIDAGDPNSPIGWEPFPNGGRINMGAYGGTVEASKSYFGQPPCQTVIAGDINGDCKVDWLDLAILMSHWLEDGREDFRQGGDSIPPITR